MKKEIVIKNEEVIHSRKKVLNRTIVEGSTASFAEGFNSSYITPFALAIGSNASQIGFLSSFAGLFQPIGQLWGSRLMEKFSRKKIVLASVLIQSILWILIAGIILLFFKNFALVLLPFALILLYTISVFVLGVRDPSFFSWIGDLVPEKERGRFFAKRNRFTMAAGMISFLMGAFLLDYFENIGLILIGFGILFVAGIISRLVSRSLFARIPAPDLKLSKGYYFSFIDFVKRYDNFGKFAFYRAFFLFSMMVSAPFFAVYMLRDLGFSYVTFTVISLSSGIFYFMFVPLAGKFSDKYGNVKLLYISAFLFPLVPFLWSFLEKPAYLFLFPGVVSGAANAAFILGVTDFIYDSVSPQKRGLCIAYTGLLSGVGIFFGSIAGGFLIQYLTLGFIISIKVAFILSGLLMIMTSLFFLPQIKEERKTEKIKGFSVDFAHHPFKSIHSNIVWFKNFIHGK